MKFKHIVAGAVCLALAAGTSSARTKGPKESKGPKGSVTRIPIPNSSFPISQGVLVPAGRETLYLSGTVGSVVHPDAAKGSVAAYGDTEEQTVSALKKIQGILAGQKMSLGDIVMMHAYLAPDPAKGGKMDFAGFMAGYSQFFGTAEQPAKPARTAMQVAGLAAPWALIEIEVIAVRPQ